MGECVCSTAACSLREESSQHNNLLAAAGMDTALVCIQFEETHN
jgi:hypothetical protein